MSNQEQNIYGVPVSQLSKEPFRVKNGTYLEFVPDTQLFGKYQFNMEMVEKRLWNYAYLNPGLLIHCNDKDYISENGLQDLLTHEMGESNKSLYPMYTYSGENLQFVITHTTSLDKFVYSFVNGQSTEDGGTHVTSFLDGFTKGINDYLLFVVAEEVPPTAC
mgnify:CR=1 FL=1